MSLQIDANDNKLISQEELGQFLASDQAERLSQRQHKILGKKVDRMKKTDFMNLGDFETLVSFLFPGITVIRIFLADFTLHSRNTVGKICSHSR